MFVVHTMICHSSTTLIFASYTVFDWAEKYILLLKLSLMALMTLFSMPSSLGGALNGCEYVEVIYLNCG